ncbi:MAG: response regulator [Hespellia sp.]|nr:response regulator [Hespellia sp.]
MSRTRNHQQVIKGKSIFRALFVPFILVMILQAGIFYFAAVYGGVEDFLSQNSADILNERLQNRKNEFENTFTDTWTKFDVSTNYINQLYAKYEANYGNTPFVTDSQKQILFLNDCKDILISTLRQNEVNGVFLILNDQNTKSAALESDNVNKYGLCIRDMDQKSTYTNTEDLLLERAPSSMIETAGCSLDSWWEAQYNFSSEENGDYYFKPLRAAYENLSSSGDDLAYFSAPHRFSDTDQAVVSYSIPLLSEDNEPYAILGIELSTKYLASMLPKNEISDADSSCYILATQNASDTDCTPIVYNGILYNRSFDSTSTISTADTNKTNGFNITGRDKTLLYGSKSTLNIYNNNNPFEDKQLVLIALEKADVMFAYIDHIKYVLLFVALLSLILGIVCILIVSRNIAKPITALSTRVGNMTPEEGFDLGRLGITEIDQLVESIETLNYNVSKDTARAEFFSRMSHDMRTPMNAIISFSSPELLEDADEDTKDNYLDKIHDSGGYLLGLINEVLDMTKIENQKTDLICEPIPVSRIWTTVVPIIDKLAQKKQISFIKDIDDSQNLYILADEQHLNQITLNLLSNAVKFTPDYGTIHFQVLLEKEDKHSNQILCRITVRDNGVGISDDFIQKLYVPFEQEAHEKEGTGLGLSIAKKLVELMDGSIQCESLKGSGTVFVITIPFEICDIPVLYEEESISSDTTADASFAEVNLRGKHILVCEDHPLNRQIICKLLEKKGMILTNAENGQAGLEAFAASDLHAFDAILMDIRMPVMDGLTATTQIRALTRADAASIPIIAMTANAFSEDIDSCHKAGMNAHLAKPIEPQKLYHTLEQYLGDA